MGYTVDYRETLVVYLRSDSLEQAAQTLKIAPGTLYSRIMHKETRRKSTVKGDTTDAEK